MVHKLGVEERALCVTSLYKLNRRYTMRKQYNTTDDDTVLFVGSHAIVLGLFLLGMWMA